MSLITGGLGGHPGGLITSGFSYSAVTVTITTHGVSTKGEPLTHQVSLTIPVKGTLLATVTDYVHVSGIILSNIVNTLKIHGYLVRKVETEVVVKGDNVLGIYYILDILDDE